MKIPRLQWLLLYLSIFSGVGLMACRDGNSTQSAATSGAAKEPKLMTNSTLSVNSSQGPTNEQQIIFVTFGEFTGDLKTEAYNLNNTACHKGLSGLEAANCICNLATQQLDYVSTPNKNLIPKAYKDTPHYFKALLQGNDATIKGIKYYNLSDGDQIIGKRSTVVDAKVNELIAIATGPDLLGIGGSLSNPIAESPLKVWTGLTPAASYTNPDAMANIPAGVYGYFWIVQSEINAILNLSQIGNNNQPLILRPALNKVRFACGKFNENSYELAEEWSSAESMISITLPSTKETMNIAVDGVSGEANSMVNYGGANTSPDYKSLGYTGGTELEYVGTKGCGEKRHLYCVGPYSEPTYK